MEQTPMWRTRSARWAVAAALLAAGAVGAGILGASLSSSADPVVTPSTQASSPTQDTDGEKPAWQDLDGEQPE
jgi:hypothetical protein